MGTNYYAHIMPSSEDRNELTKKIIVSDNFDDIIELTNKLYGDFYCEGDKDQVVTGVVHLGKRSSGWKFCWDPNVYEIKQGHIENKRYVRDPSIPFYVYPLTKEGIKQFIDRKDVIVKDEYGEIQDKEEFWKMALEWDGITESPDEKYDHRNSYTEFLENIGIQLNAKHTGFISDGLRFAAFTNFA